MREGRHTIPDDLLTNAQLTPAAKPLTIFRAELAGCDQAGWEDLFAGYTALKAITFSSSIEMLLRLGDRPEPGGCYARRWRLRGGGTMRWRIMLELAGPDGTPQRHEVSSGERLPTGHTAATLGLSLEEGKAVLAAVQRHLVTAQVDEHC